MIITANFSNSSSQVVTSDSSLVYSIIDISGAETVIEKDSESPGVFGVLAAGTAKIQIDYRDDNFVAVILVP
ncbi:MAG: hypothetical protein GY806_08990 [Gammaproteobacteria bacterium]|nr:hypothetical protein [Gammaproteobacteria bacterium]